MPEFLLIAPPLWNPYAPHLAVPLLAGCLREAGVSVRAVDLGVQSVAWMLTPKTMSRLSTIADQDGSSWASTMLDILQDQARIAVDDLRDAEAFRDNARYEGARRVIGEVLSNAAGVFGSSRFDLTSGQLYYSIQSSDDVMRAVSDSRHNPYVMAFEELLPPYLLDGELKCVGISVSADTQLIGAMTAANMIRNLRPDVKILLGGNFITRVLDLPNPPLRLFELADLMIVQEGEEAVVQAARWAKGELGVEEVCNAVYVRDGQLVRNGVKSVSLQEVPRPYFGDYDLSAYLSPEPIIPIMASRSCAWECAFCAIPFASGKFRSRSAHEVVDEMDALASETGASKFMFVDEIMTLRSLKTVGTELLKRGRTYHWYTETRFAQGLTPDLAVVLHDSGCRRLNLGLETYNQRVLDAMRKEIKLETVDANLNALIEARVPFHLFTMVGFPGETAVEARRTIAFAEEAIAKAKDAGLDHCTWGMAEFALDAHSPVAKDPLTFGVIPHHPAESEDMRLTLSYSVTSGLTMEETTRIASGAWDEGGPAIRKIQHGGSNNRRLTEPEPLVEEHSFLRACHGVESPDREPRRSVVLAPVAPKPDYVPADVLVLEGLDASGAPGGVALVSVARGLLLAGTGFGAAVRYRRTERTLHSDSDVSFLRAAHRFGLAGLGTPVELDAAGGSATANAVLELEWGASVSASLADGSVVAHSTVTSTSARLVGRAAVLVTFLAQGESVSLADFYGDDPMNVNILQIVDELIRAGIVGLTSPTDSDSR